MTALIILLYAVEIIVCFLLGGIILLQKPKDGGVNVVMGGMGESVFGAQMGNVLVKGTVILGVIFLLNTLILSKLTSGGGSVSIMDGARLPSAPASSLPYSQPSEQ